MAHVRRPLVQKVTRLRGAVASSYEPDTARGQPVEQVVRGQVEPVEHGGVGGGYGGVGGGYGGVGGGYGGVGGGYGGVGGG